MALADSTLVNLHQGSQVSYRVYDINYPIEATVLSCTEYGPVDFRTGFGYWSHCEVEYRDQYLVRTRATVTRSIVTADDIGTTVDLWVTCNHRHERCTVGNEPSRLISLLAALPRVITFVFGWIPLLMSPIFLVGAILERRPKAGLMEMNTSPLVPEEIVVNEDESRIVVWFGHPIGVDSYRAPPPQMEIDGNQVRIPGWGKRVFPVSPGAHSLKVWVPYGIPREIGLATAEVDVPANGGRVELEYMAPRLSFVKGSLGARGEQK